MRGFTVGDRGKRGVREKPFNIHKPHTLRRLERRSEVESQTVARAGVGAMVVELDWDQVALQ